MFDILYDKQPLQFLKHLKKGMTDRITDKINSLFSKQLVPHTAKSMIGHHGVFRVRIGNYRVLYRINYEKKRLIIIKLNHRQKIY